MNSNMEVSLHATRMQAFLRMAISRHRYVSLLDSVVRIQKYLRRYTWRQKDRFLNAACEDDVATIEMLLEEGWDVNCNMPDDGRTHALHYASQCCSMNVARLLLNNNANVNCENTDKLTLMKPILN